MAFEWDVLISYAHIDNHPLPPEDQGWIHQFRRALEQRLEQVLGTQPRILVQENTQAEGDWLTDSVFGDSSDPQSYENGTTLENVASFVPIVSPLYVRSKGCRQDLRSFCRTAVKAGGLWVDGRSARIFKVVKSPIPLERQPKELQRFWGYDFFEFEGDRLVEYGRGRNRDIELRFFQVIDDLAYDIQRLLLRLNADKQQESTAPTPDKVVYLAETSHHLTAIRDDVRRELELSGYWVLPDRPLPFNGSLTEEIQASLALSDLSVHLLDVEDLKPLRETSSSMPLPYVETARMREQLKLAAKRAREPEFSQILWVPGTQERQYWEPLLARLPEMPDVLQTGVEELKTVIQRHLEASQEGPLLVASSSHTRKVYLDFDRQDLNEPTLNQIRDWLSTQFEVLEPNYADGEGVGSSEHKLRQVGGVLIYYGQGSEDWLKRRLNALHKSCAVAKIRLPRVVYVGPPHTSEKQALDISQIAVIRQPFTPETLQLFATRINDTQEG